MAVTVTRPCGLSHFSPAEMYFGDSLYCCLALLAAERPALDACRLGMVIKIVDYVVAAGAKLLNFAFTGASYGSSISLSPVVVVG